jgi:predicted DNA-binding transcriptional regulator YafY
MFDVLRGTSLYDDIASVLRKLEQRMTDAERAEHATFGERVAYVPDGGTKLYEGKDDILDAILTGVLSRRVLQFEYRGASGRAQRGTLAAYALVIYRHGLYVVGSRTLESNDRARTPHPQLGVFAVERFIDATTLREIFSQPAEFRLEEHLPGALEGVHLRKTGDVPKRVVIDFSKSKAAYVRARQWHKTQAFADAPDGGVRLTFSCMTLQPIVSWVLEWGPHARVIEPRDLVDHVVAELREALHGYSPQATP